MTTILVALYDMATVLTCAWLLHSLFCYQWHKCLLVL